MNIILHRQHNPDIIIVLSKAEAFVTVSYTTSLRSPLSWAEDHFTVMTENTSGGQSLHMYSSEFYCSLMLREVVRSVKL